MAKGRNYPIEVKMSLLEFLEEYCGCKNLATRIIERFLFNRLSILTLTNLFEIIKKIVTCTKELFIKAFLELRLIAFLSDAVYLLVFVFVEYTNSVCGFWRFTELALALEPENANTFHNTFIVRSHFDSLYA